MRVPVVERERVGGHPRIVEVGALGQPGERAGDVRDHAERVALGEGVAAHVHRARRIGQRSAAGPTASW